MQSQLIAFFFLMMMCGAFATKNLPNLYQTRKGIEYQNINGKQYQIKYNTVGLRNDQFIQLDAVIGLTDVQEDIDKSQLLLTFDKSASAQEFVKTLQPNFVIVQNANSIMRRLVDFSVGTDGVSAFLHAVPIQYDEVFSDATVSLTPLNPSYDKQICLGVNSNADCTDAKVPIPLFSNKFINVQCSDCFLTFQADVQLEFTIHSFKLVSLSSGLKNMSVAGKIQVEAIAQEHWSVGVDKMQSLLTHVIDIKFNIGIIPVHITFDIPVEITAEFQFNGNGHALVGVIPLLKLGDLMVTWDQVHHWSVIKPTPVFTWKPLLEGQSTANLEAHFAVIPTVTMIVENLVKSWFRIHPQVDVIANAKIPERVSPTASPEGEFCGTATGGVVIDCEADLGINIPWMQIEFDKVFHYTIFDSGTIVIYSICVPI